MGDQMLSYKTSMIGCDDLCACFNHWDK